jgi:hypothetical protein
MSETTQEASIVYSNISLEESFLHTYPSGSWDIEENLPQQSPKMYEYIGPSNDPFTQENLLENEIEEVQRLIFRIRISRFIHNRESLGNRLAILFKDAMQEDSTSPGISIGSLRNFYDFLQLHNNLKRPSISLTPDNNIYTAWRTSQGRLFSVHFLNNGEVRFVLFKPNDRHPERQIRIAGTVTADMLKETVAHHGLWDWISK